MQSGVTTLTSREHNTSFKVYINKAPIFGALLYYVNFYYLCTEKQLLTIYTMKKVLSILSLLLLTLVACEKPAADKVAAIQVHCDNPFVISYEGGNQQFGYIISNPVEGVQMSASFTSYWITDITVHDNYVSFNVDRNREKESRSADMQLKYGETSLLLTITQEGKTSDYDYEIKATVFGGEYTGNDGNDNYNYYVQLGDAEINANNNVPNGTYYYFDIYAAKRGGEHPILPNGTYTLDPKSDHAIGTFTKEWGKAHVNDADGQPAVSFQMVSGTVTVTDNKFEAVVYMEDGTSHHIVYEGELYVPTVVSSPEYGSKLTEDYNFEFPGYMRLYYYGDDFGIGADYWSLALMENSNAESGNYFQIKIITQSCDSSYESLAGTYAPCSDLDPQKGCFLRGLLEGNMYIGSQIYWGLAYGFIDQNKTAPVYDGEIKIEVDGQNFTITLDCVDDNGHKIAGTFTCSGADFYDRSGK